MTGLFFGMLALIVAFGVFLAVWSRWRTQSGGGFGPTEFSDGSMTTTPTGYPEEMHGAGKKISGTNNKSAGM